MQAQGKIIIKKIHHRGSDHYGLFFDYDLDIINKVKTIPNRKYSKTLQCWYLPMTQESVINLEKLEIVFDRLVDQPKASPIGVKNFLDSKDWTIKKQKVLDQTPVIMQQKIALMMDYMLIRWYPWRIIKNYIELIINETKDPSSSQSKDQSRAQKLFKLAIGNNIHDY